MEEREESRKDGSKGGGEGGRGGRKEVNRDICHGMILSNFLDAV